MTEHTAEDGEGDGMTNAHEHISIKGFPNRWISPQNKDDHVDDGNAHAGSHCRRNVRKHTHRACRRLVGLGEDEGGYYYSDCEEG